MTGKQILKIARKVKMKRFQTKNKTRAKLKLKTQTWNETRKLDKTRTNLIWDEQTENEMHTNLKWNAYKLRSKHGRKLKIERTCSYFFKFAYVLY